MGAPAPLEPASESPLPRESGVFLWKSAALSTVVSSRRAGRYGQVRDRSERSAGDDGSHKEDQQQDGQLDSTRAAGFTESLRIAHLAEQFGVRIAPHQVPELHAHLCAAFPGASFGVEMNGNPKRNPVQEGLYRERAHIDASYLELNDKPGFGVEIDWDFVARNKA